MHLRILAISIVALRSLILAQTSSEFHLRGDRFKPLTADELTTEQKTMVDHHLSSPRTTFDGPFNVMLRSPEMGDAFGKLADQLRFHSSLPDRLNELAIIMTVRLWNSQFAWSAHRKRALAAGVAPAVIEAIAVGERPKFDHSDEEMIYNFGHELLYTKQVSDSAFKAVVDKFGERGAVDLTGIIGLYSFVSMMLNVDRYPLPNGDKPELKPLP